MGLNIRTAARCAILSATTLWMSCSPARLTGSGGTGSEVVIGRVQTSAGLPAAKVVVHVRRADYVSPVVPSSSETGESGDVLTDNNGFFAVPGIRSGTYRIEANDGVSSAVLLECFVGTTFDTTDAGVGRLLPYSAVNARVVTGTADGVRLFAQVRGLERLVAVGTAETFTIADLPTGVLDVRVIAADSSIVPFEAAGIAAGTGAVSQVTLDPRWHFAKLLYLNTSASGANVADNVLHFPLVVRLDSTNFNFLQAADSGRDIRFIKTDGTPLVYEIEDYGLQAKTAAFWVKIDTVFGNSEFQCITMLWGNSSATIQSDGASVFDTADGFAGVWHLSGSQADAHRDATANHADGTTVGYDGDERTTGCTAGGDSLDNKDDAIDVGNVSVSGSLTMSMWVYAASYKTWGHLIAKAYDPDVAPWLAYGLQLDSCDTPHISMTVSTGNGDSSIETISRLPLHHWVSVTGAYDGSSLRLYFNGVLEVNAPFSGTIVQNTRSVYIGKLETSPEQRFCGKIDEIRISKVARSAGWIKLSYENQRPDNGMVLFRK
jgi:hypothetical protein